VSGVAGGSVVCCQEGGWARPELRGGSSLIPRPVTTMLLPTHAFFPKKSFRSTTRFPCRSALRLNRREVGDEVENEVTPTGFAAWRSLIRPGVVDGKRFAIMLKALFSPISKTASATIHQSAPSAVSISSVRGIWTLGKYEALLPEPERVPTGNTQSASASAGATPRLWKKAPHGPESFCRAPNMFRAFISKLFRLDVSPNQRRNDEIKGIARDRFPHEDGVYASRPRGPGRRVVAVCSGQRVKNNRPRVKTKNWHVIPLSGGRKDVRDDALDRGRCLQSSRLDEARKRVKILVTLRPYHCRCPSASAARTRA